MSQLADSAQPVAETAARANRRPSRLDGPALLRFPQAPLARTRWLFLLLHLVIAGGFVPVVALAGALRQQEQALAREQILLRAATAFVAAADRQRLYAAAIEARRALVEEAPDARVSLWTGTSEEMEVVAAAGDRAPDLTGLRISFGQLPAP